VETLNKELAPYPAYKESAIPWLGEIPAHWEVKRGKTIFRPVDIRSVTGEEELLTVSSEHGIVPRRSATVTMFKAESYVGYKLCWPGDLVINSLWAWARGLGVSNYHGIISSAYGVYRSKTAGIVDTRFIHELVRSAPFHWELQVRSKGVWTSRLQLTDSAFLDAPFPLPPPEEQAAIARYLDYVDRRIRRYIRAKQQLIKLLTEQKQAIIHQAVTRGLDPDVPFKESGVEWLGQIPAHWEVMALRHRYRSELGKMLDEKRITGKHLIPYVRNVNVQWDRVDISNLAQMDIAPEEYARYTLVEGDLLVCEGGEVGRCAIWRGELALCGFQKAIHRLQRLNYSSDNTRFLYYVMRNAG
jgi:type I restriction enzyme S subunit